MGGQWTCASESNGARIDFSHPPSGKSRATDISRIVVPRHVFQLDILIGNKAHVVFGFAWSSLTNLLPCHEPPSSNTMLKPGSLLSPSPLSSLEGSVINEAQWHVVPRRRPMAFKLPHGVQPPPAAMTGLDLNHLLTPDNHSSYWTPRVAVNSCGGSTGTSRSSRLALPVSPASTANLVCQSTDIRRGFPYALTSAFFRHSRSQGLN